jgi:Triose-phosphate Transporter family
MLSGLLFQLPLWYLNLQKSPELTWNDIKALIPVAICQLGVHIGATIATGIDQGLPIAHIVKAMEPILTLGLDHILLQRDAPSELLLGLIPLVAGTVLPYWTAHKFSLGAAAAAIMIVVCSSFRVVFTHKILTEKKIGKNLDSKNLFAVLSVMTSLVLIPITLQIDGLGLLYALREKSNFHSQVTMNLCISGYLFYLFNHASFTMMESLTPTTHAVANIMRRPTVTFLFFIVTAFHKLCSFISVRLIPLSFLIWDQGFRETHTLADVLRRKGEPALASRILQPSVDSLVGSIMGFGGCLIYLNEVEGEEDLDEKKLSMMAPPGRKMGRREKKSKNQDRVRFARPQ